MTHENKDTTDEFIVKSLLIDLHMEFDRARRFPPFHSLHEGYAILDEEVDELWEVVRGKNEGSQDQRLVDAYEEAKQVGAMAVKLMAFIVSKHPSTENGPTKSDACVHCQGGLHHICVARTWADGERETPLPPPCACRVCYPVVVA